MEDSLFRNYCNFMVSRFILSLVIMNRIFSVNGRGLLLSSTALFVTQGSKFKSKNTWCKSDVTTAVDKTTLTENPFLHQVIVNLFICIVSYFHFRYASFRLGCQSLVKFSLHMFFPLLKHN